MQRDDGELRAVNDALEMLHRSVGTIQGYLAQTAGVSTTDPAPPHAPYRTIIEGFTALIREAVIAASNGALDGHQSSETSMIIERSGASRPTGGDESRYLKSVIDLLTQQLRNDLGSTEAVDSHSRQLVDLLEALRLDGSIVRVYQKRIDELLALLDAGSHPSAEDLRRITLDSETELRDSRTSVVASSLGRYTAAMKDKVDRLTAEKAKLQCDLAAMVSENALLYNRTRVLEAQLSSMAASASEKMKQLDRERLRAAVGSLPPPGRASTPLQGAIKAAEELGAARARASPTHTTIRIGDVVIDKNIAVWMTDLYEALAADPATAALVPPRPGVKGGSTRPSSTALVARAAASYLTTSSGSASPTPGDASGGGGSRFSRLMREQQRRRGGHPGDTAA